MTLQAGVGWKGDRQLPGQKDIRADLPPLVLGELPFSPAGGLV